MTPFGRNKRTARSRAVSAGAALWAAAALWSNPACNTDPTGGTLPSDPTSGTGTSDPGTVTVAGDIDKQKPVVLPATVATLAGTPVTVTLTGTDPQGDALSFQIMAPPVNGTLGPLTGVGPQAASVLYTPAAGFAGQDSFQFRANDGRHNSSTGVVNLVVGTNVVFSVNPLNGPGPLNVTGTASTLDGSPLPPGTYEWTFGGVTESGPVETHGSRTYTFSQSGVYTVALSLVLAGTSTPISCTNQQTGTSLVDVMVRPVISGHVRDPNGVGLGGVTVAGNGGGSTAVTDSSGYYEVNVPHDWTGVVTPQHSAYSFSPASGSYSGVRDDLSNQGYTATPLSSSVSGRVIDSSSNGVGGVLVSADNGGGSDTTDSQGVFSITVSGGWSGTLTPQHASYTFSPTALSASAGAAIGSLVFNATPTALTISGRVSDSNGSPVAGVQLSADNGGGSGTTNAQGDYSIGIPFDWTGTVTPQLVGTTFTPPSWSAANVTNSQTVMFNAAAAQVSISGRVVDPNGSPVASVTVSADNGGGSAVTDTQGDYSLSVSRGWSGNLTPSHAAYNFAPAAISLSSVTTPVSGQGFTATPLPGGLAISGRVSALDGSPLTSVSVVLTGTGASSGVDFTAVTASDGSYAQAVPGGWSGTVSSDANHRFEPASAAVSNLGAPSGGNDFTGFRNYYVATTGSDNGPGTLSAPFRTVHRATGTYDRHTHFGNSILQPGDTVIIRGGTYGAPGTKQVDPGLWIVTSGTATARITIKNYPGETVVIEGSEPPYGTHWHMNAMEVSADYVTIDGLTISRAQRDGFVAVDSDYLHVKNCVFDDNSSAQRQSAPYPSPYSGIRIESRTLGRSTGFVIENCVSRHNANGFATGLNYGNPDGQYYNTAQRPQPTDGLIQNCIAISNLKHPLHGDSFVFRGERLRIRNCFAADSGNDHFDFEELKDSLIEQTVALKSSYSISETKMGNGYKNRWGWNLILRNNMAISSRGRGFEDAVGSAAAGAMPPHARNCTYLNNVAFNSGNRPGDGLCCNLVGFGFTGENAIVLNNISVDNWFAMLLYDPNSARAAKAGPEHRFVNVAYADHNFWDDGHFLSWWVGAALVNEGPNTLPRDLNGNPMSGSPQLLDPYGTIDLDPDGNGVTEIQELSSIMAQARNAFSLQASSGAIDAGTHFMKTLSGGAGTAVVSVDRDPTRFFWIATNTSDSNDVIQIEGVGTVGIVSMDAVNKTITVDRSITYPAGAGVSLPWNGSHPDMGAVESP